MATARAPPGMCDEKAVRTFVPFFRGENLAAHRCAKESTLMKRLESDLTSDTIRSVMVPLVRQTSAVSLRALDWAVVNWSKKNRVFCITKQGNVVSMHDAYKDSLHYWKRRLFDPFRRRKRLTLVYGEGEEIETTLGQTNFMHFAFVTGILSYVTTNIHDIERDMNRSNQAHRAQKRARQRASSGGQADAKPKRQKIVAKNASKCTVAYEDRSVVTFF